MKGYHKKKSHVTSIMIEKYVKTYENIIPRKNITEAGWWKTSMILIIIESEASTLGFMGKVYHYTSLLPDWATYFPLPQAPSAPTLVPLDPSTALCTPCNS